MILLLIAEPGDLILGSHMVDEVPKTSEINYTSEELRTALWSFFLGWFVPTSIAYGYFVWNAVSEHLSKPKREN